MSQRRKMKSTNSQMTNTPKVNPVPDAGSESFPPGQFSLGEQILDRYEIFGKRQGGNGIVYFVEDVQTSNLYAVKTYQNMRLINKQAFLKELELYFRLPTNEYIAQPLFVEFIAEQPFVFMEYVSGGSLRDRIGLIGENQAINFAYQICLGMEHLVLNDSKIVHADLKPENILITKNKTAKIADFGSSLLFKFYSGKFASYRQGTLPYMSPEHLSGQVIDEQSDIFSFGMLFCEMITGSLPYPFSLPADTKKLRELLLSFYENLGEKFSYDDPRSQPWNLRLSNPGVEHIISACLMPESLNRWRNFRELREIFDFYFKDVLECSDNNFVNQTDELHRQAVALHKLGKIREALDTFNNALVLSPLDAELWLNAAKALADYGMTDTANKFVKRALELNPNIRVNHPKLKFG